MTDLALAAMEADIEAIAKLETWRAKMQLDHDSKEYMTMKKALLKSSSARLTKGQGARSKAKAKKEKLQWPTKSERTAVIKADDWDKAMATFQKRVHGHWALGIRSREPKLLCGEGLPCSPLRCERHS